MNNWKNIWNKKGKNVLIPKNKNQLLHLLISLDGYDTKCSSLSNIADWKNYIDKLYNDLDLNKKDTVYEVGVGSGALLFSIKNKVSKLDGLDYSEPLLKIAKSILPESNLELKEAINLDVENLYDCVIGGACYIYFENLKYAKEVTSKIIQKAKKSVAILDVNDLEYKNEIINIKKEFYGDKYKALYENLNQMFYNKEFFEKIAKKHNAKCIIKEYYLDNVYKKFRYNVIIKKN